MHDKEFVIAFAEWCMAGIYDMEKGFRTTEELLKEFETTIYIPKPKILPR